jgi:hypothetical protein
VNMKHILIYSLLFFCGSLLSFISSARASGLSAVGCTPVVYAFRHAEDQNGPPTVLTPVGMQHANLYSEMLTSFEITQDFCPVRYVYAVNPTKPPSEGGGTGTTNPKFTARPLANIVMNLDPIITLNGVNIGEFLTPAAAASDFQEEMINKAAGGSSVAVFWTSQGLHALGEAIAPGTNLPVKDDPTLGTPPRNAAYVFAYFINSEGFPAFRVITNVKQYVQCFNTGTFTSNFSPDQYYCGKNTSNLSELISKSDLYKLHGRICDTAHLKAITPPPPQGTYYGYCQSPP